MRAPLSSLSYVVEGGKNAVSLGVTSGAIGQRETHLGDDEILRESSVPYDRLEFFGEGLEVFLAHNELMRVVLGVPLAALLLGEDLAYDGLVRVTRALGLVPCAQLDVGRDLLPAAAVVGRVVAYRAARRRPRVRAVDLARPDEVVRLSRTEVKKWNLEGVGLGRGPEFEPVAAGVGRIEDFAVRADEVGALLVEGMHGEGEEAFLRVELLPGEALVARLPDGEVRELDENGLLVERWEVPRQTA